MSYSFEEVAVYASRQPGGSVWEDSKVIGYTKIQVCNICSAVVSPTRTVFHDNWHTGVSSLDVRFITLKGELQTQMAKLREEYPA